MRQVKAPLRLLSLAEIQREGSRTAHSIAPHLVGGVTKCDVVNGRYIVNWIGVPCGLSSDRLAMIMAHELMHAFLFHFNFPIQKLGLPKEEGMCELASFLWMTSSEQSTKPVYAFWKDQMFTGTNTIYHRGFQKAHNALETTTKRVGRAQALPTLLEHIRNRKSFPK
jgi:hypothetical protein